MSAELLRVVNLTKRYGTLVTLQSINFAIGAGEVVGLAGRTGSGKSELASVIAGLDSADDGTLVWAGQPLDWPFDARMLGIETIHQQPELVEQLDVCANIVLGSEVGRHRKRHWLDVLNRRRMYQQACEVFERLDVSPALLHERVGNLSAEQRQLVAIARSMIRPARLRIIDEATELLSYRYQQQLLALIQAWHAAGEAVLFCSNNLDHLFAVTDRIVVLRQGRQINDVRTDQMTREDLVNALVGLRDQPQLTPISWALDSYYRAREQTERMHHQQTLLQQNLAARDSLNRELVAQLSQQVSALDQVNLALQDAHRRLLTERERERKHLARELHDQVIQDLLSINYELEDLADQPSAAIDTVRHDIRSLIDELRRICSNLRPPTIDSLGLEAALQSHIHAWSQRTGIAATLSADPQLGRLPEAIELSVFRIVQESLSNVRKHAHADKVHVSLTRTSPRTLLLAIADDGRGLPPNFDLARCSAAGHYGLLGISERVALLDGRMRLHPNVGGGLILQAEIPHPRLDGLAAGT